MEQGVKTHIPQPLTTEPARPSRTALNNKESVWKHLRRFTANGWVRAFPESCSAIWMEYGLLMHSTHFVEQTGDKKERLVADLGRTASVETGKDANSSSPDADYAEVQADYVDEVAASLVAYIETLGLSDQQLLIGLKADIKAAFMQVALHLDSIGTLCISWDGWCFVFVRTPFGWKWATHTFSPFTKAIKHKLSNLNQSGFLIVS